MTRAVVACPGRGAYAPGALHSLPADDPWVVRADELRAEYGLPSLRELDTAPRFDPALHLRPANAAPLVYLLTLFDAARIAGDNEVVAVIGNSMGWYTALACAGALSVEDGFRLVQEMALLAEQPIPEDGPGGQVIYPLADAAWQRDPSLERAVEAALGAGNGHVHRSVELGAYAILAGTERGVQALLSQLPPVRLGERQFPLRLALHGPDHTPLVRHIAGAAQQAFAGLEWRVPETTLIDGRGRRFTPWSTDPQELASYTLDEQVVSRFDFATALRVALREYAPDVLLLPGPGSSLGGIVGQIMVAEGYRGIRSRAAFEAAQTGRQPLVLSMRR
jgi:[acyl-carrier-protein] S-malonyltransferase